MNSKVQNPKVEVKSGTKLNDKDYLNSLLSCLKEMVKNYSVALTEASCENLYNMYKETYDKYLKMQRAVYELAFRKGWYTLEVAEANKISDKYLILNNEYNGLNG